MTDQTTGYSMTDYMFSVQGSTPYRDVLSQVQKHMSIEHADLLSKQELSNEDIFMVKKHMENYLISASINCNECKSLTELQDRLFKDMVLFSFLTDYLDTKQIDAIGLEEININSWECISIKTAKHGKVMLDETFLSPQHAIDVITRLLRRSGTVMDDAKPVALGHIAKNVRIAGFKTPVLDEEVGVSASIRVVSFSKLTRRNLVEQYKTVPEEALTFLETCLNYGISMCIAGATGSGKTGTAGYLLSTVAKNSEKRILTIEEGSREFDLIRRDEQGKTCNDVVHLLTRPSENAQQNITQDFLLENILRYDPDVIGVGEMRSHEAITAAEASETDHTVITTTHCRQAHKAYKRMVRLAKKKSTEDDAALFDLMVSAFPLVVYQKQYADKSRKVAEIIEAEFCEGTTVHYRTLWRYIVENNYQDETGRSKIMGHFERGEQISDELRMRLIDNGVPQTLVDQF